MTASCRDIEEVIPLGPLDAARFDGVAHGFVARGYTPIARSIRRAAESLLLLGDNEHNSIVLVSDGEEMFGGDPCARARALEQSSVRVRIHSIGLASDQATRARLQCLAEVTGGTYRDAVGAEELGFALNDAAGAALSEGSARFGGLRQNGGASPMENDVVSWGWPEGTEVTLHIDDPGTEPGTDCFRTGFVEVAPWNPGETVADFYLEGAFRLRPGHSITCSGSGITEKLTVSRLAIFAVDTESDIARGAATPVSELEVLVNPPRSGLLAGTGRGTRRNLGCRLWWAGRYQSGHHSRGSGTRRQRRRDRRPMAVTGAGRELGLASEPRSGIARRVVRTQLFR